MGHPRKGQPARPGEWVRELPWQATQRTMPAMSDCDMEQLGRTIGVDIFTTLELVREWFMSELSKELSVSIPQTTIINSALEPPLFAVSHFTPIAQKRYAEPELGEMLRQMNDTIMGLLSELSFESDWKESNFEFHKSKIAKHYYYWLGVRQNYYLKGRRTVRGKFARLISSNENVDMIFLRPILKENLQNENFKIRPALVQEFATRVVTKSYEIPLKHPDPI